MIQQTRELVYASIAAGLLIASLQGFAGGLVFAILGLTAPVFWGVMMGFLALLPFVGTWIVWMPAAIWLIATGQVTKGITLIVFGATSGGEHRQYPSSGNSQRANANEWPADVHQPSRRCNSVWLARHRARSADDGCASPLLRPAKNH
jgi:AI-2E family transporter